MTQRDDFRNAWYSRTSWGDELRAVAKYRDNKLASLVLDQESLTKLARHNLRLIRQQ